jgi:integrase
VRLTLGRYGELTPAAARREAEAVRGLVRAGRDPQAERAAARAEAKRAEAERKRQAEADTFTLRKLVDRWAEIGLADRSASHQVEAPRALRTCFAGLLDRPAAAVGPAAVQRVVDGLAKQKPVMARRARDYGRAMFNWAVRRRLVPANPFAGVAIEGRETSRDRVLSDAELGEAWRAAGGLGYPFGPFLQLLILTLQRRGEVAGMRWRELSYDLATWTLPAERTKNRIEHIVHLAEPARAILRELPRLKGTALVFHAVPPAERAANADGAGVRPAEAKPPGRTRPISGFSDAKGRLLEAIAKDRAKAAAERGKEALPLPALDWRVHDFRRTGVTALARLGIPPHVADRLLNHVQGSAIRGVAAVYQRHDFLAERAAALRTWAAHVLAVADGRPVADNVVELRLEGTGQR